MISRLFRDVDSSTSSFAFSVKKVVANPPMVVRIYLHPEREATVVWEMELLFGSSSPTGLYSNTHSPAAPAHLLHVPREE
jgi:hypothetical protein